MKLIDTRATDTMPTSLFLSRAEFKELYPHKLNSRINYIFKFDQPMDVNDEEAKLLMKKYPHVVRWDKSGETVETNRHQELGKMKYTELKKHGITLGLEYKDMMIKRPELIELIVKKEIEIETAKAKQKALGDSKEAK